MDLDWTGQTIGGRFRLERELGRGGMGTVYLGRDESFRSRKVVVKVPHPNLLNAEFRARFELEIDQLVELEHPRVIHVYDAGEHQEVPYLVVQYVDGGDLEARMPRGTRLSPEQVLQWLGPVAEALDFIHRRGAVHRDIKPGNILFDADGNPFLSDFGISTVMTSVEGTQAGQGDAGQLTQAGAWVGSPAYAPPEIITRELSPQYDQYSLAVVAYEALAGGLPFDGTSSTEIITAKMRGEPIPITEKVKGVPPGVADAIMKALAPERGARFDSCVAFADAFRAGFEGRQSVKGTIATPALGGEEPKPESGGFGRVAAIAAGVLLLLGVGVVTVPGLVGDEAEPRPGETAEAQVPASADDTAPSTDAFEEAEGIADSGSDPGVDPSIADSGSDERALDPTASEPEATDRDASDRDATDPGATDPAAPDFGAALAELLGGIGSPEPLLASTEAPAGDGPFPSRVSLCAPLSPGFEQTAPALWRDAESGAWSYSCSLGEGLTTADATARFESIAARVRETVPEWEIHRAGGAGDSLRAEQMAIRPTHDVGLRISLWSFGPESNQLELWVENL